MEEQVYSSMWDSRGHTSITTMWTNTKRKSIIKVDSPLVIRKLRRLNEGEKGGAHLESLQSQAVLIKRPNF